MTDTRRILVVGGGFSGMSAAILLASAGNAVDLVEIDPGWRSYGAGISLNGGIFRVFARLGILDAFRETGAMTDGVQLRSPGDHVIATLPTPPLQEGAAGSGGAMRPALARILADRTRAVGTNVRLGVSVTDWDLRDDGVTVSFSDSTRGAYDLVIGADGLYSATRAAIFPDAPKPRYIGQAVWRAVLPRPAHIPTVTMWVGGDKLKYGVNHVSATQSYLFVTEDRPGNDHIPADQQLGMLVALLRRYPAKSVQDIADGLNADSQVIYRPLEQLLLPRPWHRGRVVLIGDAVHATTPHLASGAMIGMEDAVVLADELAARDIDAALDAFEDRRWERCRMVVENSGRLAEIEQGHGTPEEHQRIMGQSLGALAAPI